MITLAILAHVWDDVKAMEVVGKWGGSWKDGQKVYLGAEEGLR